MDIYAYGEKTGALKRLTTARGYDAEASYSPDGQWIVFSSMRDVYDRPADRRRRRSSSRPNPSYFAEIYIMRADGSEQKRLTTTPGYDGGPFFTHDGSRIVWRRFDEQGLIADVWTMKLDGSDAQADHRLRIDELGAVRASVRRVHHLRVEQARASRTSRSSWSTRPARRSRCA